MHNTRDLADSALTVNASAGAGVLLAASQQLVGKRQRLRDAVQAVPAGAPDALGQIAAITWDEVA